MSTSIFSKTITGLVIAGGVLPLVADNVWANVSNEYMYWVITYCGYVMLLLGVFYSVCWRSKWYNIFNLIIAFALFAAIQGLLNKLMGVTNTYNESLLYSIIFIPKIYSIIKDGRNLGSR